MTYDHELVLIEEDFVSDELRNQIRQEVSRKTVLCDVKSIGQNEFYNAAVAGFRPTIVFVVHSFEYDGEQTVEFEGEKYRVIRTYSLDSEEVELTCERLDVE